MDTEERTIVKDVDLKPENKTGKRVKEITYTVLAALIYGVAFHYFIAPCRFAPGGIMGIVAILQYLFKIGQLQTYLDFSAFLLWIVTFPFLFPAAKFLSKDFAIKTFFNTLLTSLVMFVMDNFIDPGHTFCITRYAAEDDLAIRILAAVFGGVICGFTLSLSFKINSSTGGTDVIGAMLQKKFPHRSIASFIFSLNSIVILISIPIYRDTVIPVLLALIYGFVSSKTCDFILQGSKNALKYEVITEHGEEMAEEIIAQLGHGVTVAPAKGMFEVREKDLLICVIQPRQVAKFHEIIKKYPDSFAYVGSVNEIIGKFNKKEK